MDKKNHAPRLENAGSWLSANKWTVAVLFAALVIFIIARVLAAPAESGDTGATEYSEYETGTVTEVMSDTTEQDATIENAYRGEQLLQVEVTSGRYKGETLLTYNYVGPLYGVPLEEGDRATLLISSYEDGTHNATVYEYNRTLPLAIVVALFLIAAVAVGGKTGAKSLIGLIITLACLFLVLIPLLMKGAPAVLTVFLTCAYIAAVSLTILGGIKKKTICAMLGAIAGAALALGFGYLAQSITRIDGLRISDVEPLLQLRQAGIPVPLRGLLVCGIIISALGAVMDVTMGIASSMTELKAADPELGLKGLFRSGMNIGRDMVGTMTNTLILAFIGSSFTFIIYLYSLGLQTHQLLSSAYLSIEVISGVASSVGVILAIPLTAFISAAIISKD